MLLNRKTVFFWATALMLLGLTIGLQGCLDCNDCGPTTNEALINARFRASGTSANSRVRIMQVNGIEAADITNIGDTLRNIHRLPLDMNSDTTVLDLVFRTENDTTVLDTLTGQVTMAYERVLFENDKDFFQMQMQNVTLLSHTFDSTTIRCDFAECINDESTLLIFYE